ncbi:N-acetyltransferase family protein [Thalassospiraceae bacterium LMO-JJ14]|nr:N-acetyltransferase family protein [Thalassospiraceae bacterium LMO-JJ14]
MQPPLIRPRTDADMAQITAIYTHHVLHGASSWELTPPDEIEMIRRAHAIEDAGYPYLVAERDGVVAGYAYASAYRPRPAYRNTVELSIYIDDTQRRAGIGSALMTTLIDTCTDMGFRQMIAIIGDSQNRQSIDFHEKMGFVHVGKVHEIGYKFGRWMDQIIMQRPLGAGASTPPDRP